MLDYLGQFSDPKLVKQHLAIGQAKELEQKDAELAEVLAQGSYVALAPYVLGLSVFYWLKALRWAVILTPFGAFTWREVAPSMMIGFAASTRWSTSTRSVYWEATARSPT